MSTVHEFKVYDFENNLNENGTIELQCKLKFDAHHDTGKVSYNTLCMQICHDFGTLQTAVRSFKLLDAKYLTSILNIKPIKSHIPNLSIFAMDATILDKHNRKYTKRVIEKMLCELQLVRFVAPSGYEYRFTLRFIRIPAMLLNLGHGDDVRFSIPLEQELNDRHVLKYVFRSTLMTRYGLSLPYDILVLLFDEFIFDDVDENDLSKYYGQLTHKEIMVKFATAQNKEKYLKDEEFVNVFNLTRTEFYALKPWIRKNLKREKGFD